MNGFIKFLLAIGAISSGLWKLNAQECSPKKQHIEENVAKLLEADSVDVLIKNLASESFAVRDAAQKKLLNRIDARPALRHVANFSNDLEVRQRADTVLKIIRRRCLEDGLRNVLAKGEAVEIDLLVEQMVVSADFVKPADWKTVQKLVYAIAADANVAKLEKFQQKWRSPEPFVDLTDFKSLTGSNIDAKEGVFYSHVLAERIIATDIIRSILICRGPVECDVALSSIVLCNGDLTLRKATRIGIGGSIVICDGDLAVGPIACGLFIASGDIRHRAIAMENGLGLVVVPQATRSKLRLKWFSTEQVGMTIAKDAALRIQIATIEPNSTLAKAGLKQGDRILSWDDTLIVNEDGLRRALRGWFAKNDGAVIQIRRDATEMKVVVP